jgi:Icc-related predicted phosphoesterase
MRCLVVSDLHYALPQFDWVMSAAPQFDLVIFAGDALDVGSIVDAGAQILVVRKYLQRIASGTKVIFCSGNHDLDSRDPEGEKVARWIEEIRQIGVVADGDAVILDDTLYTVCPWWDGPKTRERLLTQLDTDAQRRGKLKWVWAHHAPPRGSQTSWSGKQSFGDDDLVSWIERFAPDIVVCGHIHQAPFVSDGSWADRLGKTWVFNAGRQYGAPPAYIVIDTGAREALWISAMGAQSVCLDAPLQRPIARLHALPEWYDLRSPP